MSYARSSSGTYARQLADQLQRAGCRVFLDTEEIPLGTPFPEELAAAIRSARVSVVFADNGYFAREWCLREFDSAVSAEHARVIVALPTDGVSDSVILPLPPTLARRSWPTCAQTGALVSLVSGILQDRASRDRVVQGTSPLMPEGVARPAPFRASQVVSLEGAAETLDERFIGRAEEMWRLFHALETRRFAGAPRVVLLSGGAGSGKSQLAAEYARRVGPRYYDAVFWTSADAPPEMHQQRLDKFLALLGGGDGGQGRLERLTAARLAALAREGKRVLWVVDNVPEPGATAPAPSLSTWCPVLEHVSLLATSRRHQLAEAQETIALGPLEEVAGIGLLTMPAVDARWLGDDDWREIVRWVGALPLALRILQAALSDGTISAPALLARARQQEPAPALDDELSALQESLPAGALRGVASAFGAALEALRPDRTLLDALARVALLPPWPMRDAFARRLTDDRTVAALARRGWLQPVAGGHGERQWRLHRIAASFVRLQTDFHTAMQGVLEAIAGVLRDVPAPETAAMRLEVTLAGLAERISQLARQPDNRKLIEAAERVAMMAVQYRLGDPEWRGLRYTAAQWLRVLVAWDLVLDFSRRVLRKGDPGECASLPHMLQPLGNIPQIAGLIAELLHHPDEKVRLQALVHAGSYAPNQIFSPVLRIALQDPDPQIRERATMACQQWISDGREGARLAVDYCSTELASPAAEIAMAAIRLAGEIIAFQADVRAEPSAGLISRLQQVAIAGDTREQAAANALAAAHILGSAGVVCVDSLSSALGAANLRPDDPLRLLAIDVLGEYLRAIDAPRRPTNVRMEYDEDGGPILRVDVPPPVPHRPEWSQGLLEIVVKDDGQVAQHALDALLKYTAGQTALKSSIATLFDRNDVARILWISDSWIAADSKKEAQYWSGEPYWWRGMVREQQGDFAGALSDYLQVTKLAPGFGYAFKRIARLQVQLGHAEEARIALRVAQRTIADDPELSGIAAAIAAKGGTG